MKKIFLFITTMFFAFSLSAEVIYVSPQGTAADGLSWSTAWQTVEAALDTAHSGDEIWVQQGTYTLTSPAEALYYVSGVNVYGGFAGTESALDARSTDASLTVIARADSCTKEFRLLTGATADDATLWDGFTFTNGCKGSGAGVLLKSNNTLQNCVVENCINNAGEESYSSGGGVFMQCDEYVAAKLVDCIVRYNKLVVNCSNKTIGGAGVFVASGSSAAVIENCVIDSNIIEGVLDGSEGGMGAGILMFTGEVTNTEIINNKVVHTLGKKGLNKLTCAGICIFPEKETNNVVNVTDCVLKNNCSETGRGGAILIDPFWSGTTYKGTYTFKNCLITGNYAQSVGAGCLITTASAQENGGFTTNFFNCIISNNTSEATGGALFGNSKGITLNMTNCTIVRNHGMNKYGGQVKLNQSDCIYTLTNCLLWGNTFDCTGDRDERAYSQMTVNAGNTTNILSCAIENGNFINYQDATVSDSITLSMDNEGSEADVKYPCFVNATDSTGAFGDLDGAADWHLNATSACIDWGMDVSSLITDFDGNTRPLDGSGLGDAYYDIGAYEYDPNASNIKEGKSTEKVALDLYSVDGKLILTLEQDAQVEVYNIAGQVVRSFTGVQGVNEISVSRSGLYIVRVGQQVGKTIVF